MPKVPKAAKLLQRGEALGRWGKRRLGGSRGMNDAFGIGRHTVLVLYERA